MKATALDSISRELGEVATRRGLLRLLGSVSAAVAIGAIGAGGLRESAAAKRRGRKRGKRNASQPELSQSAQYELYPIDGQTALASSIPPNCIYVCCDGTCDSWKMCLKCVKWPKPTATTSIAVH